VSEVADGRRLRFYLVSEPDFKRFEEASKSELSNIALLRVDDHSDDDTENQELRLRWSRSPPHKAVAKNMAQKKSAAATPRKKTVRRRCKRPAWSWASEGIGKRSVDAEW
jgi:hypothetical protein